MTWRLLLDLSIYRLTHMPTGRVPSAEMGMTPTAFIKVINVGI